MNPAAILIGKSLKVVGENNISENIKFYPPLGFGEPEFEPPNDSSAAGEVTLPFSPAAHMDSSMGLVAIVVVTGIIFCFLSALLRRFVFPSSSSAAAAADNPSTPSLAHHNRKGGLDPSAAAALPLVEYDRGAERRVNGDCSICLSEFEEGETVKLIPNCGHVFHAPCIDAWLSTHVTCPLCRSAQLFEMGDVEEGFSGGDAAAQA